MAVIKIRVEKSLRLQQEVIKTIQRDAFSDLTVSEVVGVLEFVKFSLIAVTPED